MSSAHGRTKNDMRSASRRNLAYVEPRCVLLKFTGCSSLPNLMGDVCLVLLSTLCQMSSLALGSCLSITPVGLINQHRLEKKFVRYNVCRNARFVENVWLKRSNAFHVNAMTEGEWWRLVGARESDAFCLLRSTLVSMIYSHQHSWSLRNMLIEGASSWTIR